MKTFEDYKSCYKSLIDEVEKANSRGNFYSNLFRINFPFGTVSYIGARPSRGKTTTLISLGIDALMQNHKVIFITLEESPRQLYLKFISAHAKFSKISLDFHSKEEKESIKDFIKQNITNLEEPFCQSFDFINQKINNGDLLFFDGINKSYEELKAFLEVIPENYIVLLDYIQRVKSGTVFSNNSRQTQIQIISRMITDITSKNDFLVISGGQFKREKDGEEKDIFSDCSFRESGDIEQDGQILIGIGRNKNEYYYSILKNRDGKTSQGKYYRLQTHFDYSLICNSASPENEPIEIDFSTSSCLSQKKHTKTTPIVKREREPF